MTTSPSQAILLSVFSAGPGGGNPCPVVLDADGMTAEAMRALAAGFGHESGFVFPPKDPSFDYRFRFFVPLHEMEMCGHATLGAAWLLRRAGRTPATRLRLATLSGPVRAAFDADGTVAISQPPGRVANLDVDGTDRVLAALGLARSDLRPDARVANASTSRIKTLVPLRDARRLHDLAPRTEGVRAACDAIGSTGLYPFAPGVAGVVHARQFPQRSGYLEDAATGIAATALFYGLGAPQAGLIVRQGEAMGRPSEIVVSPDAEGSGCLIRGRVEMLS